MPRTLPVMLIHGFSGDPGDWTDGGFRRYLVEQGDLDPDLVRLFRYGVAPDGTYNNRGDVREIAARLAGVGLTDQDALTSSVDRLSADSVARGGPPGVTLIGHSMGGIISRYYLSRGAADEFGALYRGHVARLITIGSPHRGVGLLRLAELAPRNSLPWRFIRLLERLGLAPALPASAIEAWEAELDRRQRAERARLGPAEGAAAGPGSRVMLTDSPIYQQLAPDSPLLAELNQPGTMPAGVECHTFYGDIRLGVRVALGGLTLLQHAISLGDLAVPADSAREIPYVPATSHPYVYERALDVAVRLTPAAGTRSLWAFAPDVSHVALLANPAVHDAVLSLLND